MKLDSWMKSGNGTITLVIDGQMYQVGPQEEVYNDVLDGLKGDYEAEYYLDLIDKAQAVEAYLDQYESDVISISHDTVYYTEGETKEVVENSIVKYILEFQKDGLPIQPLINMLTKMYQNTSMSSIKSLYDFLDNKNLPVCEDGDFLAWKAVRNDYRDKWTGRIDNSPGQTVSVSRRLVSDDRSKSCSFGLHVGTLDYVKGYGSFPSDRIILVKVNPKNAVSVPDHESEKMRVCEYTVLKDCSDQYDFALATNDGDPYEI